jgi:tetratricopeptide (TPR) repeat protein
MDVVALDPTDARARDGVRRVRTAQAEALVQLGEQAETGGRIDEAIAAWKEAQRLAPSKTLGARLTDAEVSRCLQTGIAHYEAQRLPEAVFQLKKALTFDPENEEARRYLGYAQGLSGDTNIADRFARLE